MNYYPFHVGDYIAHTAHLDPLEDIAYRRMLDLYYMQEQSLPNEPAKVARLIRMREYVEVVATILEEFFNETDEGWRHDRCDAELAKISEKSQKAKESAAASVKARLEKRTSNERSTNAERTLSEDSTNAELPNTQDPIPKLECGDTPLTPQPDPAESQAHRRGQLAALLRERGVDITPAHPDLCQWVASGLTDAEAQEAVARARLYKPPPEKIPANYLAPIVPKVIADRDAPSGPLPRASPSRKTSGGYKTVEQQNREAAERAKAVLFGDKSSVIEGEVIRDRA
jgi:uncharacterized protein YdaU (DUF1376 family)